MIADFAESYITGLPVKPNPALMRLLLSAFYAGAASGLAEAAIVARPDRPTLRELVGNINALRAECREWTGIMTTRLDKDG